MLDSTFKIVDRKPKMIDSIVVKMGIRSRKVVSGARARRFFRSFYLNKLAKNLFCMISITSFLEPLFITVIIHIINTGGMRQ